MEDNDKKEEIENNNDNSSNMQSLESESDESDELGAKNQITLLKSSGKKLIPNLNQKLEKIHEKEEENYSTNLFTKDNTDEQGDPIELITSLRNKISDLEEKLITLRGKNDELKKNNIKNDSMIKRMSFIGIRRNFSFSPLKGVDEVKLASLMKEKNDLQEINEKLLNMVTDKELEIEELQENYDNYKNDMKKEIKKYLENIDELEDKIEILEENNQNKEKFDDNLEDIINEYNKYKVRMEKLLNEHIQKEEELQIEVGNKENMLQNIKSEMQNLELENIQLKNNNEQREKVLDNDLFNLDKALLENEKLKVENNMLQDKIKNIEESNKSLINSKDEEIKTLTEDLEFNNKNLSKIKEEKTKEITSLKSEINKYNKDINNLIKKNDALINEDKELKEKNSILQGKLDKKIKELQEINESAKKLIENKENKIQEYEEKLDAMYKDKNQLIEQNHELLDKIKNMNTNNLGDILNEDEENEGNEGNDNNYENALLHTEIKNLKEQLLKQAQDLVNLNAMEKEISRLKEENEKLLYDYKSLKEKINKQKYEESADDLMSSVKKLHESIRISKKLRKLSISSAKTLPLSNKKSIEKQLDTLKQINEDEKSRYMDEIDKLNGDIAVMKVKYMNQQLDNEMMIAKYRNILKSITEQCNKIGIKLNFSL